MDNLIPLAAYHADETGYWKRLRFVSGLFFGFFMAVSAAVFPMGDSKLLYPRIARGLFAFLFGGVFFGLLFPLLFRRKVRALLDGLYAGKSWIDQPPPEDRRLDYRFPCSLIVGQMAAIGGVMYVGPDGMVFAPRKRNRPKRNLVEIGPLGGVSVSTTEPPTRNLLQRILVPHALPLLRVEWPGGSAILLVPSATSFAPKLSELIRKLRG